MNDELDNTIFFPSNKKSYTKTFQQSIFPIKIASETTFLIQIYWEIMNWANLCSWTFGQSETSDLIRSMRAGVRGRGERFWIFDKSMKRCSRRCLQQKGRY